MEDLGDVLEQVRSLANEVEQVVLAAMSAELPSELAGQDPLVRRSDRADFQSNVALALAKRAGENPRDLAEKLRAGCLHSLARAFSEFYDGCPVLKADTDEVRANRLARWTPALLQRSVRHCDDLRSLDVGHWPLDEQEVW